MTALLDVQGAEVTFGGLKAVNDVSLTVEHGAIVGLIGPNGAGKTTLFNLISGLQPGKGRVTFEGKEVAHLGAHRRASLGIGRSFQNLGLIPDETVLVNVLAAQFLGCAYRPWDLAVRPWRWWKGESLLRKRAMRVLRALGVEAYADVPVADLSFGIARFVELAAVLVERPALMLLDEPTTGLDVIETETLVDVLRRVRQQGTAVLVVAHNVRFIMDICDHVYVLAEGKVLSEGPPQQVQNDPAVATAYLGKAP